MIRNFCLQFDFSIDDSIIDLIYIKFYENLILYIDAIDNGIE